jgi:hypothetical protein
MSQNRAGGHPGKISGAAQGGATILVLLGLVAIALGVYLWSFEAARPSSQSSDGTSWLSGLGYGLAIILIAVGSVPVSVGGWILVRPGPVPLGIGTVVGGGYGGLVLLSGGQSSRPFDQGLAILFIFAALFLLAAVLLAVALVNATPPPKEATRGRRTSPKQRTERWREDRRAQKPPPGYGTRRP